MMRGAGMNGQPLDGVMIRDVDDHPQLRHRECVAGDYADPDLPAPVTPDRTRFRTAAWNVTTRPLSGRQPSS